MTTTTNTTRTTESSRSNNSKHKASKQAGSKQASRKQQANKQTKKKQTSTTELSNGYHRKAATSNNETARRSNKQTTITMTATMTTMSLPNVIDNGSNDIENNDKWQHSNDIDDNNNTTMSINDRIQKQTLEG